MKHLKYRLIKVEQFHPNPETYWKIEKRQLWGWKYHKGDFFNRDQAIQELKFLINPSSRIKSTDETVEGLLGI